MRSTLPALFRNSLHQEPIARSPQKQGPYYDLNLTISHSYRTKAINPLSHRTLSSSSAANEKSLVGRYAKGHSRAMSLGRSQENSSSTSYHKLSEIDNVKFNLRRISGQANQLEQKLKQIPLLNEEVLAEIKEMGVRIQANIGEIEHSLRREVEKLRERVSLLRRETNMEQKLFKKELSGVNDELLDSIELIKAVQEQRATLKRLNF